MFELLKKVVAGALAKGESRGQSAGNRRVRPTLEALEDRLVPALPPGSPPVQFTAGMTLTPGQSVTSNNGQITLVLQGDGNLVEYNASGQALFATNTAGQTVTQAVMQGDGNFVLYNGGTPVFATNTDGNPGAFLEIRDDGKLVITTGDRPLWARGTPQSFTLTPGGNAIYSANGQNFLVMQGDGNLVEYNTSGQVLFATNTDGSGAVEAVMQNDGNLVLYTADGTPVFSTHTFGHPNAFLDVLDNGHVSIFNGTGTRRLFPHTMHQGENSM